MTTPAATERETYRPDPAQLERAAALRRFNSFFVYLPAVLAGLAVFVLVGLLLWGSLSPHILGTKEFASALADIVVIAIAAPLMLLCAIGPGLAIAYGFYRRRQPKKPYGQVQVVLWRAEALVLRIQDRASGMSSRLAKLVIVGHARATYLRTWWQQLRELISRS